ncbi:MAG: hypothetical protein QOE51_2615 [Actinoplanes sp.]|nr:hypothetical protein [Actinoplanes sp.]
MRYLIAAVIVFLAAGAAVYSGSHGTGKEIVTANVRIVRAPVTAAAAPVASSDAAHHPAGPAAGASSANPGGQPGGQLAQKSLGVPVGFTMIGGLLFLVTANDPTAAAGPASIVEDGGNPGFICGTAPGVQPAHTGGITGFKAWEVRNYGGSGALPQLSADGQLLTAPQNGQPLTCNLAATP